ncbi:MAG: FAD-dependent oxidoreductase [Thermodesulfobacteriota bacterium]
MSEKTIIIGGGPAGLTAAYELAKAGQRAVVLEKDRLVGGISKTVDYKGYHFDLGGHRFFTKIDRVNEMWREVLSKDLLHRSRLSRIYYNKKFFYYPLKPFNALSGLGFIPSVLILLSYLKIHLFPLKSEESFEEWVTNRFGRRLYETFFKTYTEKVWGIPCTEIKAEWAAQRIKGLSLISAVRNSIIAQKKGDGKKVITTLIDSFDYPKLGPGMMWRAVADRVLESGSKVLMESNVTKITWEPGRVRSVSVNEGGRNTELTGENFISSMPIRELIGCFSPEPPKEVISAANSLKYRDFLTVALIVDKPGLFPDNWIYVHDEKVKLGRIQNFKNWSPHMVPDQTKTCLGLEYFCFEGDELWNSSDEDLIELGKMELKELNLASPADINDGSVVRVPKAYPVYDAEYRRHLETVKGFLATVSNLQLIGRAGMHKYNNQDHSMLTAMLAVENILGSNHDLWEVNEEKVYHEEKAERPAETLIPDQAIIGAFSRIDKLGLATAIGLTTGLIVLLMTLTLVIKGGDVIGPNFRLLSEYFIGYSVTLGGALIGGAYGFVWGFILGWLFSYLRNFFLGYYIYRIKRKTSMLSFRVFLDHF